MSPPVSAAPQYISLRHSDEYPMNEGRVVTSKGLDIDVSAFEDHVEEQHVARSNALHCVTKADGRSYHVGPMARHANNVDLLPIEVQAAAAAAGLGPVCVNPFRSITVRAVETLYAVIEALRLIDGYAPPEWSAAEVTPRAGTGHAATEAPRGLLYHRYGIDGAGLITAANIVPPTAQNQPMIEDDLRRLVPDWIDKPDDEIQHICEQAIRTYDPCISCATHFLKLDIGPRSTHVLGLAQAVELARVLGTLPPWIRFIGAEGTAFQPGADLSPALLTARDTVVAEIAALLP
ncbi:nickel-dependent hydrogenase large subunit [Rhodospira trueperi]|uniref:nickel-dependent hydrogenase large subunit n=1 Tax=Rhodospira trueperi TaxID=69960 RepID=UPI0015A2F72F|nr:nickel-dependent hydrogenase large subunit [Rhodospira trueperi]